MTRKDPIKSSRVLDISVPSFTEQLAFRGFLGQLKGHGPLPSIESDIHPLAKLKTAAVWRFKKA